MRTDLLVPAGLVPSLQIPPLSVTTGEAEVEWVDVPTSRWRFRRRPAQRLPLDRRSARRARQYVRFAPWSLVLQLIGLLALAAVAVFRPSPPIALAVVLPQIMWFLPYVTGALPRQAPYRTPTGDLRIPAVPIEVAKRWVELNTGVLPTTEPPARARSRRWYAAWAAALLIPALVLGAVMANDGREDSALLWFAVPALFLTGVATALKTLPPGHIRFEHGD